VTHLYQAGVSKTTGAAAGPIATLVTASSPRAEIVEIGVFATTAVASTVQLGRPAAAGTGGLTGQLGQAMDPNDVAGASTLVTSFATTQPTAPTNVMAVIGLPGVIGAGMVWTWNRGEFILPISSNLVLWQLTTSAVGFVAYMKWYE
jgi:hypothetical protein